VLLDQIGSKVQQVFFVVNIYTRGRSFSQVAQPFCRVVDDSDGSELCRYCLRDAGSQNGLIIAKIAREAGGRWGFHALGLPCRGQTYKDSLPQIRQVSSLKTSSLLLRSTTSSFEDSAPAERVVATMVPHAVAHQALAPYPIQKQVRCADGCSVQ